MRSAGSRRGITQLSAEDILQDPATADMWLRGVQQDPSNFLAIKFSMQLQREEASPEKAHSETASTWLQSMPAAGSVTFACAYISPIPSRHCKLTGTLS